MAWRTPCCRRGRNVYWGLMFSGSLLVRACKFWPPVRPALGKLVFQFRVRLSWGSLGSSSLAEGRFSPKATSSWNGTISRFRPVLLPLLSGLALWIYWMTRYKWVRGAPHKHGTGIALWVWRYFWHQGFKTQKCYLPPLLSIIELLYTCLIICKNQDGGCPIEIWEWKEGMLGRHQTQRLLCSRHTTYSRCWIIAEVNVGTLCTSKCHC